MEAHVRETALRQDGEVFACAPDAVKKHPIKLDRPVMISCARNAGRP